MLSGAEQLKEWMDRRFPNSDRKARDTAELFGWDETFISKLANGHRAPGLANAHRIEQVTGIPTQAWLSSEPDTDDQPVGAGARKRR